MSEQHDPVTERIIGCAFKVHNALGQGFLEKVYENALAIALRKQGFLVTQQQPIHVYYDEQLVGVGNGRAIIDIPAHPVAISIVIRILRTGVTRIA